MSFPTASLKVQFLFYTIVLGNIVFSALLFKSTLIMNRLNQIESMLRLALEEVALLKTDSEQRPRSPIRNNRKLVRKSKYKASLTSRK